MTFHVFFRAELFVVPEISFFGFDDVVLLALLLGGFAIPDSFSIFTNVPNRMLFSFQSMPLIP